MSNFSAEEIKARIELVKPIVKAAFSLHCRILSENEIAEHAAIWEASFRRVATPQLRDLYHVGIERKCRTAAEFQEAWEAKVAADVRAMNLRKSNKPAPRENHSARPVPPEILNKWRKGVAQ